MHPPVHEPAFSDVSVVFLADDFCRITHIPARVHARTVSFCLCNPSSPKSGSMSTHRAVDVDGGAGKEGASNLSMPTALSANGRGSFL